MSMAESKMIANAPIDAFGILKFEMLDRDNAQHRENRSFCNFLEHTIQDALLVWVKTYPS